MSETQIKSLIGKDAYIHYTGDHIYVFKTKPPMENSWWYGATPYITAQNLKRAIARVSYQSFPGCCGVGTVEDLWVSKRYAKIGLGTILTQLALIELRTHNMGRAILMAPVINKATRKIAENLKMTVVDSFIKNSSKIIIYRACTKFSKKAFSRVRGEGH